MAKRSDGPGGALTFDVVIATRNRPDALALSIPLILGQSRQPEKLIVIDSSDDHVPVAEVVAKATAGWPGAVIVEASPKGLPLQRNRGLAHATADVVIFPDDDSLFHPGASAAIMAVYEADTEGRVAGVCAAETLTPPEGVLEGSGYRMSAAHERDAARRGLRNRIEKRFSQLNPVLLIGRILRDRRLPAHGPLGPRQSAVEYMTGFRMSFRRAVIAASGFDATLPGYALLEDIDASLTAARAGLLIGALEAKIFHYRFPGGRGDMFAWGVFSVLNRAYVVQKQLNIGGFSDPEARQIRTNLHAFIRLKLLQSLAGLARAGGRAQWRGAWAAARAARSFPDIAPERLSQEYSRIWNRLTG